MKSCNDWIDVGTASKILETETTAFRLFSSKEAWTERFGNSVLISSQYSDRIPDLLKTLQSWSAKVGWAPRCVYSRLLVRNPKEKDTPALLWGDCKSPHTEIATENGLHYEIDFLAGYSPGIFCDQRENRNFLRTLNPHRVLNTFAYTCAFSVAAAASGAATVNVDISRSALRRGKRNFELNDLNLSTHRFVAEDVLTYFARLANRNEKFDVIILDPPTFGRAGTKTFQIQKDFEDLIRLAIHVAIPGAAILLSTNYSIWNTQDLCSIARKVAPPDTKFHLVSPPLDFSKYSPSATIWAILPK